MLWNSLDNILQSVELVIDYLEQILDWYNSYLL